MNIFYKVKKTKSLDIIIEFKPKNNIAQSKSFDCLNDLNYYKNNNYNYNNQKNVIKKKNITKVRVRESRDITKSPTINDVLKIINNKNEYIEYL